MAKLAKHPYLGYKLYKVWHKNEKRWFAVLFKSKADRTTVAYAKYLLEVREGKRLGKAIVAHHKDEVKINDVDTNIKKMKRGKHNAHHSTKDYQWRVDGLCAYHKCRKKISKHWRGVLPRKAKKYFYCDKECLHKAMKNLSIRQDSEGVVYWGPKVP